MCQAHNKQIRGYAYIYHDKDEAEKHYHLLIRTYDAWTTEQIAKWFSLCKDENGEYVNTLNEPITDILAIRNYLTHMDADSIKAGKHQYDESEIIDRNLLRTIEKKDSHDFTYQIILLMEAKTPLRDLLRIYGKDFLYHYRQYKEFLEDMQEQEQRQRAYDGVIPLVPTEKKYHWFEIDPDQELLF